ncbi:Acetylornithine deacetylase/Succinyl-diaminopimelate desuccinylase [Actinacidiphila yanglinensis]|uniref:Acetylornithine deacetylase/Succinyl-diaminopimelate desuccinylase n=1 Tax=Actinacidiphila yanglinensis TaxID=310779 RepID=A0A1H6DGG5_9ACTN|nr:M20/M25/M40 family metallo-hydrolase [Actinacidiphila yanglinensis]SEG84304.1 Acetylornithine deacetylase/Succinyl-diaminopimelate desuccinylase [Actinacidiphila yanglinensis]
MDHDKLTSAISAAWSADVLPSLSALIGIPAVSPAYDAAWQEHGHLLASVHHFRDWLATRSLPGMRCEVVELPGRSPVLLVDTSASAEASAGGTVLLYGHLDRQPPVSNWSEGLGPWQPVLRDGRLYGRGSVDDGYSGYAAITALEAVRAAGGAHTRTVLLLETGEESGSPDLPAYLDHLAERLHDVSLVISLDAGGGDYERMWLTSSLRGVVQATVTVRVMDSGMHSGLASGIVPSSFRIMRQLLDRVEDPVSGEVLVPAMRVAIPQERLADAEALAAFEPGVLPRRYPLVEGMRHVSDDDVELILNSTWRPTLSVIGAAGFPEPEVAGAVLRAWTSLRLSFRLPPTADAEAARAALVEILTTDVPYGAQVEVHDFVTVRGWHAPIPSAWLDAALEQAGERVFGASPRSMGLGGGIPFMEMLGKRYPQAQFVVTGAVGADSNMHVPDEWLNIRFAEQITTSVAYLLDAHARRPRGVSI